ncbi:MAG: hypothetical protein M0Q22_15170 [Sulfuritalea sp.]|jgi:hypothetical protein|nr:hypothetical protein [Sulfuritalea sp.]
MIGHKIGQTSFRCLSLILVLLALALSGCGGGGGGSSASADTSSGGSSAPTGVITGVAAVGLPLAQGTVTVKDATGSQLQSAVIDSATGGFTLNAIGGTPPYFLMAQGKNPTTNADVTLYSIATERGTANINPLTNLIVATAALNVDPAVKDPAALFSDPARFKDITSIQLSNAKTNVMANLSPQVLVSLQTNGAASVDPIRDAFAVGKGLDKVFDNYAIHVDGTNGQVQVTDLKDTSVPMPAVSLMKLGPASVIAGSYYYSSAAFNALFVVSSNGGIYGLTSAGSYQGNLMLVDPVASVYTARLTLMSPSGTSSSITSRVTFAGDTKQLVLGSIAAGGGDLALGWAGGANSTILAADVQDFLIVDQTHNVTLNRDPTHKLTYLPGGNGGGSLVSSGDLWILAPDAFAFVGSVQVTDANSTINIEIAAAMSTASIVASLPLGGQVTVGTITIGGGGSLQAQGTSTAITNWSQFAIGARSEKFELYGGGAVSNMATMAGTPTALTVISANYAVTSTGAISITPVSLSVDPQ